MRFFNWSIFAVGAAVLIVGFEAPARANGAVCSSHSVAECRYVPEGARCKAGAVNMNGAVCQSRAGRAGWFTDICDCVSSRGLDESKADDGDEK